MGRSVYAVINKDEEVRANSRSGGIFTALTDWVLDNGGIVYGCKLNDDNLAVHMRAATKEERNTFRGSKYIQSDIGSTYSQVKEDLEKSNMVLYSGTPCQIAGLNKYLSTLKVDTSKLITVDILCHGVPSPLIWKDYLKAITNNEKIEKVDFRNKEQFGWHDHVETIITENNTIHSKKFKDIYFSHLILRPACYDCYYRNTNRVSDITIGDYWHIDSLDKSFDDDKGTSLVMTNTDKGKILFDACMDELIVKEFPLVLSMQPAFNGGYAVPSKRNEFWDEYNGDSVIAIIDKYTVPPQPGTLKKVLKRIKSLVRSAVSVFVKILEDLHII